MPGHQVPRSTRPTSVEPGGAVRSPWLMLGLATTGFAINFWAWALLSPLGPVLRENGTLGALSEWQLSLIVAVPVFVGSLGRIPVEALTTARVSLSGIDRSSPSSCTRWSPSASSRCGPSPAWFTSSAPRWAT